MNLAFFDALRPKQIGFITGSIKAMVNSPDFENTFKDSLNCHILDYGGISQSQT